MSRIWFLPSIIAAAAAVVAIRPVFCTDQEKQPTGGGSSFVGKVVVVSLKSHAEYGATLEKARVTSLGGKAFLVGAGADDGQAGNWVKGRTVWIPLDEVVMIAEFPDLAELKKADARPPLDGRRLMAMLQRPAGG